MSGMLEKHPLYGQVQARGTVQFYMDADSDLSTNKSNSTIDATCDQCSSDDSDSAASRTEPKTPEGAESSSEGATVAAIKTNPKPSIPDDVLDAPLVQGGLWKAIWLMSWPLLISTVATSVVGMVDVQVSSYLGAASQAAVGLAEHITFMFMIAIFSISVGTTAIVSREFGEGNTEETLKGTAQSLMLSFFCGTILAVSALSSAHVLLPFFSSSKEVIELGSTYLSLFGFYLIPFSVVCITGAAFRAIGDSRTGLIIVIIDVIINIIGDYLTVRGNWPVPGLGIKGIAASGVIANMVAAILAVVLIARSPLKKSLTLLTQVDWIMQKRILKVGLPSAIQRTGWASSVFALFFILRYVPESTSALASWTIGMRVEGLLFMPMMAFSLAVSSIVGQNLGAKKEDRAMKAGWNVTGLAFGSMAVLATLMFVFADQIAAHMSQDPTTIKFSASYMRINAVTEPFLAVAMVLMGALQGAGDTKMPMVYSLFCNSVVRLPLAWWLAITLNMGTDGVWISMAVSVTVCAVLCTMRFKSGEWMKTKV